VLDPHAPPLSPEKSWPRRLMPRSALNQHRPKLVEPDKNVPLSGDLALVSSVMSALRGEADLA
jgi:hypothetical protein